MKLEIKKMIMDKPVKALWMAILAIAVGVGSVYAVTNYTGRVEITAGNGENAELWLRDTSATKVGVFFDSGATTGTDSSIVADSNGGITITLGATLQ